MFSIKLRQLFKGPCPIVYGNVYIALSSKRRVITYPAHPRDERFCNTTADDKPTFKSPPYNHFKASRNTQIYCFAPLS